MNPFDTLLKRTLPPIPFEAGGKIPWNDPDFSNRMLREHLNPEHDAASRRPPTIDRHVEWIHRELLQGKSRRVLDLACGPGLYCRRLAGRGHHCRGIDFSPAAIAYAREQDAAGRIEYIQGDVRSADYGKGYDLVMMIFGEFNVFTPADATVLLRRMRQALKPGGTVLLEVHSWFGMRQLADPPTQWFSAGSGLFSERPHVTLQENHWLEEHQVAVNRFYVIETDPLVVSFISSTTRYYTDDETRGLLAGAGLELDQRLPGYPGADVDPAMMLITARPSGGTGERA